MSNPVKSPAAITRDSDTFLRGLAICCVIIIHFLSSFKKSPFVSGAEHQIIAVTLDQLGRVSVPLFVALSGYGLMQKYQRTVFRWSEFLKKRVFQLLPLYVVWSAIYWLIFWFIPQWRPTADMKPFFGQLFFGNADYHLYFVPMIFQLYLLFPLLLIVVKKYPSVMLLLAGIFQFSLYWLIDSNAASQPGNTFFQSDQKQYLWAFSWIFYFVLGMCMASILKLIQRKQIITLLLYATLIGSACWVSFSAVQAINQGVDPLVALRFTRMPVLVYASSCIIFLFLLVKNFTSFSKLFLILGKHSYLIYLSHTLILRIIFTFLK